jgi:hypothetical protein
MISASQITIGGAVFNTLAYYNTELITSVNSYTFQVLDAMVIYIFEKRNLSIGEQKDCQI